MPKLNDIMAARPAEKRAQYTVQMIPYTQLIPNRENKYSLGEIEELANMIRLAGGIPEPLFARKRAPGEYELISGHRRRLAVIYLVKAGIRAVQAGSGSSGESGRYHGKNYVVPDQCWPAKQN